jgi:uncharacterized protein (DUF433 family)
MTAGEVQEIKTELASVRQELQRLAEKLDWLASHPRHVPDPTYPNIVRVNGVQGGEPMIRDKYVTVTIIVALVQLGQTPEEIVSDYDGRLTLADVHAALSYYYANQDEIDGYLSAHQAAREQAGQWSKVKATCLHKSPLVYC